MKEREKTKPIAIKKLLDQFLKEHDKKGDIPQSLIVQKWTEIMPKGAEAYTKPVSIKNKTLIITVSNSAWLYQITLKKENILKKIKKIIKNKEINDIRFKIG